MPPGNIVSILFLQFDLIANFDLCPRIEDLVFIGIKASQGGVERGVFLLLGHWKMLIVSREQIVFTYTNVEIPEDTKRTP